MHTRDILPLAIPDSFKAVQTILQHNTGTPTTLLGRHITRKDDHFTLSFELCIPVADVQSFSCLRFFLFWNHSSLLITLYMYMEIILKLCYLQQQFLCSSVI